MIDQTNDNQQSSTDINETDTVNSENIPVDAVSSSGDSEIDTLKKDLDEQKNKYLRVLAEYDNYRKRSVKEKSEAFGDGTIKTVTEFLGVIDNFERAMAAESTDENFKNGMQMIFNQYIAVLKKVGVSEIEAQNVNFDPNLHHAVSQTEDPELGENVVAQVYQKGYVFADRVIRPAMVVVANP